MKEIILGDVTRVSELATKLEVSARRVIEIGFRELGLMITIAEHLPFDKAKAVAERLGFTVLRSDSS